MTVGSIVLTRRTAEKIPIVFNEDASARERCHMTQPDHCVMSIDILPNLPAGIRQRGQILMEGSADIAVGLGGPG